MAANPQTATVRERCRVAPHDATKLVAEQYLPLTFFDMRWLNYHPIPILIFYKFSCSKTHFFETVVPHVKKSLSRTLKHFLPLAGNLLYPFGSRSGSGMPVFRYVSGDSVSVTIAEASEASDFNYLTANYPRDCDQFYAFAPELPESVVESESGFKKIPLFSVQITLFPHNGICMGICSHHAIADASGFIGFIDMWSSIAKLGGNDELVTANDHLLPIFDRSLIKDPTGVVDIFWNQQKRFKKDHSRPANFPTNKVRATFILEKNDIQRLKNSALAKNPALFHLSSFTVTTAYVWSCLVKSKAETGEEVDGNEPEFFAFSVDVRSRLNPPVPAKYFGNCVRMVSTGSTRKELKGKDGFLTAVNLIGDVISKKVDNKEGILKGIENYVSEIGSLMERGSFGVAGTPKFELYEADFGWGKPNKIEFVWIDEDGSMSLLKSREFEGGLEIGLSLPKPKMDAFEAIFSNGLKKLYLVCKL